MKLISATSLPALVLSLLAVTVAAGFADKPADDSAKVTGSFTIDAKDATIEGVTLRVQLWEYDPRLADVGATLIEKIEVEKVSHTQGKATKIEFTIGEKATVKPMRNYYVTLRGHREGKYVYYGKPTHDDIGRVITEGKPRAIEFAGKRQ